MKAAPNSSTAQEVRRHEDLRHNYFTGTKKALIAAGVCKADWFPRTLVAEFRKDGQPYRGNSGKQRVKRAYRVEGRAPETILTHRVDAEGQEYWVVSVAVEEDERQRREDAENEKWTRTQRRNEEHRRQRDAEEARAREAGRPIVDRLRQRYPGCASIDARIDEQDDGARREIGTRRQMLEFNARSLEILVGYGLVTQEMLDVPGEHTYRAAPLRGGGSFWLSSETDSNGREFWHLRIWTDETPRERKHLDVREARQLLKRIAARG